ncbi:hypothetical protein RND71_001805 [Anisodus tanguticus]|uniref:Uncharacterized protein n=1 Tax=Anisodus tanguticus TaxID=243964 RepID=A0AAE1VRD7_9SOLA|nr:hypothetical protein RND71_001805 [Anisodus tanguticus]
MSEFYDSGLVLRRTKGILVFSHNEFPLCYSLSLLEASNVIGSTSRQPSKGPEEAKASAIDLQKFQEISDPEIMVSFPIVDDPEGASFVARTTTPWTLSIEKEKKVTLNGPVADTQVPNTKTKPSGGKSQNMETYEVVDKFPGSSLVGKKGPQSLLFECAPVQ